VVRRQEDVELSEHAATDVAEDRPGLDTERLPADGAIRPLAMDPFGQRFEDALEAADVLTDPIAAAHHPRAGAEAVDRKTRELGDVALRPGDVAGEVLAHPGAIRRRDLWSRSRNASPDAKRRVPVGEAGGVRAHRPVDVRDVVHAGPTPRPRLSCGRRSSPLASLGPPPPGGRCPWREGLRASCRTCPDQATPRPARRGPERRPAEAPRLPQEAVR